MVAILMLAVGVINEEQNAYAGNGSPAIWCEVYGDWTLGEGFWSDEGECTIYVPSL